MAQERIKWTISPDGMLSISFGKEMLDVYALMDIFPTFTELTEVQRMTIIYGIKQNLSDKIAGMKDYTLQEKVKVMGERFKSLVEGVWKTPSKEKVTFKKKAETLIKEGGLSEVELALLTKLGLR